MLPDDESRPGGGVDGFSLLHFAAAKGSIYDIQLCLEGNVEIEALIALPFI